MNSGYARFYDALHRAAYENDHGLVAFADDLLPTCKPQPDSVVTIKYQFHDVVYICRVTYAQYCDILYPMMWRAGFERAVETDWVWGAVATAIGHRWKRCHECCE